MRTALAVRSLATLPAPSWSEKKSIKSQAQININKNVNMLSQNYSNSYFIFRLVLMSARRLWTLQEDQIIASLVTKHGTKKWTTIADEMKRIITKKGRSSKQIRERWHNHLDPSVNKRKWSEEEEAVLFDTHRQLGSKWKEIASRLEGRTDNHVKNYFYSTMRRALRRVNKYLGYKNSTTQMRTIRPSILSYLLDLADHSSEIRSLVTRILELSKLKPTKATSCYSFVDEQKQAYQSAITKLMQINESYTRLGHRKLEEIEELQHCYQKIVESTGLPSRIDDHDKPLPSDHEDEPSEQEQASAEEQEDKSWHESVESYNGHSMPEWEKPEYECDLLTKKQESSEPFMRVHFSMDDMYDQHRLMEAGNLFEF